MINTQRFQNVQDKAMQDQFALEKDLAKRGFQTNGQAFTPEQQTYWNNIHKGQESPAAMRKARLDMNNPFQPQPQPQTAQGWRGGQGFLSNITAGKSTGSVNGVLPNSRFATNVFK